MKVHWLLALSVLPAALLAASVAVEDFEAAALPAGWSASAGSELSITGERFKHGEKSLLWTWNQSGASASWIFPDAFKGSKIGENFNFWFYNEAPAQKILRVDFVDEKNAVVKKCWWPINFRGWRPLGAPYNQVFPDVETLHRVVGVRFTAPEGMNAGRFYFDFMRARSLGHVIWDLQHPWCFFEGRLDTPTPDKFIYSPYDLALNHPDLPPLVPEDQFTPEQRRDVIRVARALEWQNAIMSAHAAGASTEDIPREKDAPDEAYVFPKDFYPEKFDAAPRTEPPAVAQADAKASNKEPHPKVVAVCERFRQTFKLQRKDGRLTGLPIDGRNIFAIPPVPGYLDEFEIQKWAMELGGEYKSARQRGDEASAQVVWEAFRDLCEYALDQGASAGGMNGPSGYFGHWAIATMREPLEKAGLYRDVALANVWAHIGYIPITERVSRQGDVSIGGTGNTDFIYGNYNTIIRLMMNLPPAERLQYLRGYSRILNMICDQQSPMCAYEPFEIDGAFIHHNLFNLNYGGAAYEVLCNLASIFSKTQFQFKPGAVAALKRTAVLLAFLGNTSHAAPNASGYCGDIKRCYPINQAEELARLGTTEGQPIDSEMASLYLGLVQPYRALSKEAKDALANIEAPPMLSEDPVLRKKLDIRHVEVAAREFEALGFKPAPPAGHYTLNSAAGAIHRREQWSVTLFGITHLHRGFEDNAAYTRSIYNRYIRNGSAFVISSGTPTSPYASGCRLQGWDWRFIPGATSMLTDNLRTYNSYSPWTNYPNVKRPASEPKPKELSTGAIEARYFSAMQGGTDLEGDGIWGFECLSERRGIQFRKSAFCFGRRVTLLTSDVTHGPLTWDEDKALPMVTTLFQNAFGESVLNDSATNPPQIGSPSDEPCWADGQKLDRFPHETVLPPNAAHWVLDNKKTGYFIHAGSDPLRLLRRSQEWTYCHTGIFVKKTIDYKTIHNAAGDWDPNNYEATKGDFALGYFEHGATPAAASCAYTLLPSSSPKEMEALAEAMKDAAGAPYRILQQDTQAHAVWDRDSETTGYVVFSTAWKPAAAPGAEQKSGLLSAVNRPCFVMLRVKDARLVISVACTDKNRWGMLMKGLHTEPETSWRQEPGAADRAAAIELSIAGDWEIPVGANERCSAAGKNGMTQVKINYDNFLPIRLTLLPKAK